MIRQPNVLGDCSECDTPLMLGEIFEEEEYDAYHIKTGRVRAAVSNLVCPCCLKAHVIDDTFDGPWRQKR